MWRPAILQKAEAAMLDEKAAKLKGLAQVLDDLLGDSFDLLLEKAGVPVDAPAPTRLATLNELLKPLTERLSNAFPNVGLGYYDIRLDQVTAYAPHERLGYLVGIIPPPDHLGRIAMERRAVRIAIGSMVRGDAMNCVHPLIRGDQVIGFTFANEAVEDIYRQVQSDEGTQGVEMPTTFGLSSLAVFAGSSNLSAATIRAQLAEAAANQAIGQQQALSLMHSLLQVEQYTRLFLDNLGVGLVMVNDRQEVQFCNSAMARLTGSTEPLATGQRWATLLRQLHLEMEPGEELAPPTNEEPHRVRATVHGESGPVAVDILVAALPGLPGHRLYLFEETGRARRDQDYFERAERLALAGELATSIAHEIRNPLTVVAGSIQLIPDRLEDEEFLRSLSRIAGKELARVNRIIQGLLGFARYAEPERSLLDLNDLILEAVEFLGWYARKQGVEINLEFASGALLVYGDGEHLKQALLNLFMNGIQAMEKTGGRLTIRTEQPPGSRSVRIDIEDEGPGIPADALPQIWEVFYSSKPGGTGLGLPVVQRIIDAHRGYIEVDSTPGEGTCFTVLLPVASRPNLTNEEVVDHGETTSAGGR